MPDRVDDLAMMRLALAEAARGRGWVEPNPMVGAVVVREGIVVGIGHHERFGGPHAEVHALAAAGASANGGTLYVSLEPCCHHGKTPPCTEAILKAGIKRVVAAVRDPFPRVAGGGFAQLREHGVEVEVGLCEREARRLLAPFLKRVTTGRPYVIAKWAMTLDGRIATRTGDSQWISGPRSRALVHEVRGRVDGVVVGIGTALADNPRLTARPAGARLASRVVVDTWARLAIGSNLVASAWEIPVIVAVGSQAPEPSCLALEAAGCRVIRSNEPNANAISIPWLLDQLGAAGMTNILVEGGAKLLGSFFDADEVDEVDVFIAPKVIGGEGAPAPVGGLGPDRLSTALGLVEPRMMLVENDVRVQALVHRPWLDTESSA